MNRYEERAGMVVDIRIDCWCKCDGRLEGFDMPSTKREAAIAAESLGWKFCKRYGWMCPECIKRGSY